MKKTAAILILIAANGFAGYRVLDVPVLQGDWWQIAENAPDVSPYNTDEHNACDFTVWQDDTGDWHLISCIRKTSWPGETRLFHSWESPSLTNTMWDSSVFTNTFETSNGTFTVTNGIFYFANSDVGQNELGSVQAPHCFKEGGQYYMFYNAYYDEIKKRGIGAWVKISPDGTTHSFTDHTNYLGNYMFFTMGRDVMVFDNRSGDGLWYAFYTGKAPDMPSDGVVARSASSLEGPWSADASNCNDTGNPESPFIVKRGNWYYLWQQSEVRASQTITNFASPMVTRMNFGWKYAPEVIVLDGQEYIACYGRGIYLSKFGWVRREVSDADIVKLSGTDEPVFSSTSTVYLTENRTYQSADVSFEFTFAQVGAAHEVWWFSASNPEGTVVGTTVGFYDTDYETDSIGLDYGENRIEFRMMAEDGQQKTYVIFINRQNSDNSYDSYIVPMNLYPHIAENTAQDIGIRLSAQPSSTKTVTVSKQEGGDADLSLTGVTQLVFTTSNWDEPQSITIEATSDTDTTQGTASFFCIASGMADREIVVTEREISSTSDVDRDGLPDWWEIQYYDGMTGADPNAPASNGVNTVMQAYIAGIDPTDPNAFFKLSGLRNIIQWNSASGRVYAIYWTSNLWYNFQVLRSNVPWTSAIFTDSAHSAEEKGFYKIEVELE